jgi:hypothetical protein
MRTKSLVTYRSKCTGYEEGKMEKASIPDSSTVWETSAVTEEQIQSLADRGLLRPKTQVGWRPAAGEEFLTEGTGETFVFPTHIECGFSRMDLPGPSTSVVTRTDYSVGPWDYPACATRHLMA